MSTVEGAGDLKGSLKSVSVRSEPNYQKLSQTGPNPQPQGFLLWWRQALRRFTTSGCLLGKLHCAGFQNLRSMVSCHRLWLHHALRMLGNSALSPAAPQPSKLSSQVSNPREFPSRSGLNFVPAKTSTARAHHSASLWSCQAMPAKVVWAFRKEGGPV